jgi:hypothetical protein
LERLLLHQAADVVDVAGQPIELRHDDRCLAFAGERDRSRQSGTITISRLPLIVSEYVSTNS